MHAKRSCAVGLGLALAVILLLASAVPAPAETLTPAFRAPAGPSHFSAAVEASDEMMAATVFTVTNTNDSGAGSLRQAIQDVNTAPGGPRIIRFAIPTSDANYNAAQHTWTINVLGGPQHELAAIRRSVTIDGTTQGTNAAGGPAILLRDPTGTDQEWGLQFNMGGGLDPSGSVVRGLTISGFARWVTTPVYEAAQAILFYGGVTVATVEDCQIGTNWNGTKADPNFNGITIMVPSSDITIRDNVIAGNESIGLYLGGTGSNTVTGNKIGTDATATLNLGNGEGGIILEAAHNNQIGGATSAERNYILYNGFNTTYFPTGSDGIYAGGGTSHAVYGNVIQGNWIGVDANGHDAGNGRWGVVIDGPGDGNVIGGTHAGEGNVIAGNGDVGTTHSAWFHGNVALGCPTNTEIAGNLIGVGAGGETGFSQQTGVFLLGPADVTIGKKFAGNVISGHYGKGVRITAATNVQIAYNKIGVDLDGKTPVSNEDGVYAGPAEAGQIVDLVQIGPGNVISGNASYGVNLSGGSGTVSHVNVLGNLIGLASDDATIAANKRGVQVTSCGTGIRIGDVGAANRNTISGNKDYGVYIEGTNGVQVYNNILGVGADQTVARPNGTGVMIASGTGTAVGKYGNATYGNVFRFNTYDAVATKSGAPGNFVYANSMLHDGGLGIDLLDDGVTMGTCSGYPFQRPTITTIACSKHGAYILTGTACPGAKIEIFSTSSPSPQGFGEGTTFLATATANGSGRFSWSFSSSTPTWFTATATHATYGTSEFSKDWAFLNPSSVDLEYFRAIGQRRQILLEWETEHERGTVGFRLWRAESENGTRTRITGLIPAEGSPTHGAGYDYTDKTVTPNVTYYYWLEDIDAYGTSAFHGPVHAKASRPHVCGMAADGRDGFAAGLALLFVALLLPRTLRRARSVR